LQVKRLSKGVALCIGNTYEEVPELTLATAVQQLGKVFGQLGFREKVLLNVDGDTAMVDCIQKIIDDEVDEKIDEGFVFAFNGHGTQQGVVGADGEETPYTEIQGIIDQWKLRHKPKVILFDCCKGVAGIVVPGLKPQNLGSYAEPRAKLADMFVAHPTGDGRVAWGDAGGGLFSQLFMEQIKLNSHKCDLYELMTIVNGKLRAAANFNSSFKGYKVMLGPR